MNNEYRDIISFDGTPLRCLIRESGCAQWLIVTHGLGEHLERHEYLISLFSGNFNMAIYDLRGHGKSGGKRGWVDNFDEYLNDLEMVTQFLKKEFSMKKFLLFGHSMGGLITAAYLQKLSSNEVYPEKVFLSSPAVAGAGALGQFFSVAPEIIFKPLRGMPSLPVKGVLDIKHLSHDRRVYQSYVKDDLNQLKIHTHLFFEILKKSREVFSRPLRANCPLYVSIGTLDKLVNPKIVIKYFSTIEKTALLKIFEGGYHELHNEIQKYRTPYLNFLRQSLTGLTYED